MTTDPNELLEPFHDRMPAILPQRDWERWLAESGPAQPPIDLLRPFPAQAMKRWKVGKEVGNTRNNSPDLLKPCATEPMGNLPLFPG